MEARTEWLSALHSSIKRNQFVKLTLGKPRRKNGELRNIYARRILLKGFPHLSFTLRYQTKDVTRNLLVPEGLSAIEEWLGNDFLNADLFTLEKDFHLQTNKKGNGKCLVKAATNTVIPALQHDHEKVNYLSPASHNYLHALGVARADGQVLKAGQRKFRQINKYIETISHLLKEHPLKAQANIVDMGSGKGYLTFALYDFLKNVEKKNIKLTGIELRENLVEICNEIAIENKFEDLNFQKIDIHEYQPKEGIDVLIALHACDTATDEAIAKGIKADAEIIIVAPCCQKQVRKSMKLPETLKPILQHGILLERQAEVLTDGLRALYLEAAGYRTKVFEFISTEHTPKNVMITAVKGKPNASAKKEINALKKQFGLDYHHLERLLDL